MQIVQNRAAVVCAAAIAYAVLCPAKAQALGDLPSPAAASEYTVMPPRDFSDVKLATAGLVGGQSAIAVNPKNASVFVATYANQGACWARVSTNAGRTWAAAKKLPMSGKPNCDTSAVTWAPDGSRLYAAYNYRISYTDRWGEILTRETGALVSSSTDQGSSWSSPVTAEKYTDVYDILSSLKLSAPLEAKDANALYLVIGIFNYDDDYYFFSRSSNRGETWTPPIYISSTSNWELVTPPSIAGGAGGKVIISYGYSSCWNDPCVDAIQLHRSGDYGAHFQYNVVAVPDAYGSTAVAFGAGGTAHIVYTVDSWMGSPGTYYVYSNKSPYTAWSKPIALNGIPAGSFSSPALTVSPCGSDASVLHAAWIDNRAGPGKHNLYYTGKVAKTGEPWSPNLRISGSSMLGDGYYYVKPSLAAGLGTTVSLWGQVSDHLGPRPVWTSRIASGVSCP